ncbi:alpha/beta fold hydrolase [Actinosynnema sp. NPDC059797]
MVIRGTGGPVEGTAAGVPYVALPPAHDRTGNGRRGRSGVVLVWHLLGEPGTPHDMAAALPLHGLDAWRVYPALPVTEPDPTRSDVVTSWYAPLVESSVAAVPALLDHLRDELALDPGPVDLVGGSAGGHVALLTAARGVASVRRVAVVNPAVTAESVVAASTEHHGLRYEWSPESRRVARELDVTAHAPNWRAPLLVVRGELEYPAFRPVQTALVDAVPGARLVEVPGLAHMPVSHADVVNAEVTAWLA